MTVTTSTEYGRQKVLWPDFNHIMGTGLHTKITQSVAFLSDQIQTRQSADTALPTVLNTFAFVHNLGVAAIEDLQIKVWSVEDARFLTNAEADGVFTFGFTSGDEILITRVAVGFGPTFRFHVGYSALGGLSDTGRAGLPALLRPEVSTNSVTVTDPDFAVTNGLILNGTFIPVNNDTVTVSSTGPFGDYTVGEFVAGMTYFDTTTGDTTEYKTVSTSYATRAEALAAAQYTNTGVDLVPFTAEVTATAPQFISVYYSVTHNWTMFPTVFELTEYDATTGATVSNTTISSYNYWGSGFTSTHLNGTKFYVAGYSDEIAILDTSALTFTSLTSIQGAPAFDVANNRWVVIGDSFWASYDPETGSLIANGSISPSISQGGAIAAVWDETSGEFIASASGGSPSVYRVTVPLVSDTATSVSVGQLDNSLFPGDYDTETPYSLAIYNGGGLLTRASSVASLRKMGRYTIQRSGVTITGFTFDATGFEYKADTHTSGTVALSYQSETINILSGISNIEWERDARPWLNLDVLLGYSLDGKIPPASELTDFYSEDNYAHSDVQKVFRNVTIKGNMTLSAGFICTGNLYVTGNISGTGFIECGGNLTCDGSINYAFDVVGASYALKSGGNIKTTSILVTNETTTVADIYVRGNLLAWQFGASKPTNENAAVYFFKAYAADAGAAFNIVVEGDLETSYVLGSPVGTPATLDAAKGSSLTVGGNLIVNSGSANGVFIDLRGLSFGVAGADGGSLLVGRDCIVNGEINTGGGASSNEGAGSAGSVTIDGNVSCYRLVAIGGNAGSANAGNGGTIVIGKDTFLVTTSGYLESRGGNSQSSYGGSSGPITVNGQCRHGLQSVGGNGSEAGFHQAVTIGNLTADSQSISIVSGTSLSSTLATNSASLSVVIKGDLHCGSYIQRGMGGTGANPSGSFRVAGSLVCGSFTKQSGDITSGTVSMSGINEQFILVRGDALIYGNFTFRGGNSSASNGGNVQFLSVYGDLKVSGTCTHKGGDCSGGSGTGGTRQDMVVYGRLDCTDFSVGNGIGRTVTTTMSNLFHVVILGGINCHRWLWSHRTTTQTTPSAANGIDILLGGFSTIGYIEDDNLKYEAEFYTNRAACIFVGSSSAAVASMSFAENSATPAVNHLPFPSINTGAGIVGGTSAVSGGVGITALTATTWRGK